MRPQMTLLDVLYNVLGFLVFGFYALLVVVVVLRVIMKRRPIGVSLAWLALILAVPVVGISAYLIVGEVRLGRRRAKLAKAMYRPYVTWLQKLVAGFPHYPVTPSAKAAPLVALIQSRLGMPLLGGNNITLLSEPETILDQLLVDIRQAKISCYLEFYIWQEGGRADQVAEALIQAAARGVDCRILLDSVGSAALFDTGWPRRFHDTGVRIVEVLPVKPWRVPLHRQDLRMHRKLVVIDEQIAYTGSMNLVDPELFKQSSGVGQWIDIMVRVTGPVVSVVWSLFVRDWEMETGERLLDSRRYEPESLHVDGHNIQLIPSGPFVGGDCIQQILLQAIYQAEHNLVLTSPYFVPDDPLVAALQSAAARGVAVQLIIPERNDSRMVSFACNAFLEELLAAGVEIYRFRKGLLHTKSVLVDDQIALIGTVNLDRRSLWLNFEATLLVDDCSFAAMLKELQQSYIQQGKRLRLTEWRERSWIQRMLENVFYLFSPLL
ncbi:cardiolipin synthase [Tolumonas osonensis]|uniref:Cardiolipin synthase A n=1 Tax=Tolumonas osonensis TaxID=675874 RepID=A0A841G8N3_9GAMM|nr:cardiolipin synthase [Tolumonas osonensis]MBB6054259.1 cardiolipin synthase [Tolumonas osonensis]